MRGGYWTCGVLLALRDTRPLLPSCSRDQGSQDHIERDVSLYRLCGVVKAVLSEIYGTRSEEDMIKQKRVKAVKRPTFGTFTLQRPTDARMTFFFSLYYTKYLDVRTESNEE